MGDVPNVWLKIRVKRRLKIWRRQLRRLEGPVFAVVTAHVLCTPKNTQHELTKAEMGRCQVEVGLEWMKKTTV